MTSVVCSVRVINQHRKEDLRIRKQPTSSSLAIWSSTGGARGAGDCAAGGTGVGTGAATVVNVALTEAASCKEVGLEGEGVKPGLAGSDG